MVFFLIIIFITTLIAFQIIITKHLNQFSVLSTYHRHLNLIHHKWHYFHPKNHIHYYLNQNFVQKSLKFPFFPLLLQYRLFSILFLNHLFTIHFQTQNYYPLYLLLLHSLLYLLNRLYHQFSEIIKLISIFFPPIRYPLSKYCQIRQKVSHQVNFLL